MLADTECALPTCKCSLDYNFFLVISISEWQPRNLSFIQFIHLHDDCEFLMDRLDMEDARSIQLIPLLPAPKVDTEEAEDDGQAVVHFYSLNIAFDQTLKRSYHNGCIGSCPLVGPTYQIGPKIVRWERVLPAANESHGLDLDGGKFLEIFLQSLPHR